VRAEVVEELSNRASRKFVVTCMELSVDEKVMVLGGEDGSVATWSWTHGLESEQLRRASSAGRSDEQEDEEEAEAKSGEDEDEDGADDAAKAKARKRKITVDLPAEHLLIKPHSRRVTGVAFVYPEGWSGSAQGGQLAISASEDNEVRVFEVWSGREVSGFVPSRKPLLGVATTCPGFDGQPLLATAAGNEVKLWSAESLSSRAALYGHDARVVCLRSSQSKAARPESYDAPVLSSITSV